jgi:predicted ATPase
LAGEAEPGLEAVDAGLTAVKETGVRYAEADLYRVRGELILLRDRSHTDEAERCFRKAIEVARSQDAKSYELRATTRLARLLDRRGRREEARGSLAEVYGWFTEGFDTADLKDAKALLDELNADPQ